MADYIKQMQVDEGTIYDIASYVIYDSVGNAYKTWTDITNLVSTGFQLIKCTTAANTPKGVTWTSGSVTVTGTLEAADAEAAIYFVPDHTQSGKDIYDEYIAVEGGTGKVWEIIGTTDTELENLVEKGTYTGTASVSYQKPTVTAAATPSMTASSSFTGTTATLSLTSDSNFLKNVVANDFDIITVNHITAAALASTPTFTGDTATISVSGNVVSSASATTKNITAELSATPAFTGTAGTVSVSGTGITAVSSTTTRLNASLAATPSFTGTAATLSGNVTGLAGSVGTAVGLTTGTAFTATRVTNWNRGSFTQGTDTFTPNTATTATVTNEVLKITTGTAAQFSQGTDSYTGATATLTAVTITPVTGAALSSGTVTFSGTPSVSIAYTPEGTISKPGVNITTATNSGTTVVTSVSGTSGSIASSGTFTPEGTVSKPGINISTVASGGFAVVTDVTLTQGSVTLEGSYQPTGTISKPSINLTKESVTVTYFSGLANSGSVVSVSGSYQPAGSVSTSVSGGSHTHDISTYTNTTASGSATITFS